LFLFFWTLLCSVIFICYVWKGMRVVRQREGLEEAIESCRREALQAFGDSSLLIEKYFDRYGTLSWLSVM
jgi:hypothetical protein